MTMNIGLNSQFYQEKENICKNSWSQNVLI